MIFRSLYPDVAILERALHSFILENAPQRADKPALIDGLSGRTLTYAKLAASTKPWPTTWPSSVSAWPLPCR